MKKLFLFVFFLSIHLSEFIFAQGTNMKEQIEYLTQSARKEFNDLFYTEPAIKKRIFYNCKDSLFSDSCEIKRKIYFDLSGHIVDDTSFIDTLFSSTQRVYSKNKIEIIKTHPEPGLLTYHYKTTIDSLIVDSLQRPIRFYSDGIFTKKWNYDSNDRICEIQERPNDENFKKGTIYTYLKDTILSISTNRNHYKFDTIYNYFIFDGISRLVGEKTMEQTTEFHHKGMIVYFDSIKNLEPLHESFRTEYHFITDSNYRVEYYYDSLWLAQEIELNVKKEIKIIRSHGSDGKILGQNTYSNQKEKRIQQFFQDGILIQILEQELYPSGKLKSKAVIRQQSNDKEYEFYNEQGMIVRKMTVMNGEILENLFGIDFN